MERLLEVLEKSLNFIQTCLYEPSLFNSADDGSDWDTAWGDWNDTMGEEEEVEVEQSEATDDYAHKWFQDTIVSVSPAADLVALANENRLVLLARRYW